MSDTVDKYHNILHNLAIKFSQKKPKSKFLDYEDFYNEGFISLIRLIKDGHLDENLIKTSIRNDLERLHKSSCTIFKNSSYIIAKYYEIQKLKNLNKSDKEIIEELNLTHHSYYNIVNLLETFNVETTDISFTEEYDNNIILEEIYDFISERERLLLNLCMKDLSLNQIAGSFGRSHEWARIQIINLLDKIRSHYD